MFTFDVQRLIPRFLREDRNALAVAKAIEAGVQAMNDTIRAGLDNLADADTMPEWRLDEMAWEYNIPYDYTADPDVKRTWVHNAWRLSRLYGTAAGVEQYLVANFSDVSLQEAGEYGGDPFHFRLFMQGAWTNDKIAWAIEAANSLRNIRSVMDSMTIRTPEIESRPPLFAGTGLYRTITRDLTEADVPEEVTWLADETGTPIADGNGVYMT